MNLYLLQQFKNSENDAYFGCIVVAKDEFEAKEMHPEHGLNFAVIKWCWDREEWVEHTEIGRIFLGAYSSNWVPVENVKVKLLGVADESLANRRVIHAW